jgi:hypothetical protein
MKKKKKWPGHVTYMGDRRLAYRGFVERPEGKRPRSKWEDNNKVDLDEVGWEGMDCIILAEYRDR